MNIPGEPPLTIEANKLDDYWSSKGEVELHELQVFAASMVTFVISLLVIDNTWRDTEYVSLDFAPSVSISCMIASFIAFELLFQGYEVFEN